MIKNSLDLIVFDKETSTKIHLLQQFNRLNQWWTADELVQKTGITKRTVEK